MNNATEMKGTWIDVNKYPCLKEINFDTKPSIMLLAHHNDVSEYMTGHAEMICSIAKRGFFGGKKIKYYKANGSIFWEVDKDGVVSMNLGDFKKLDADVREAFKDAFSEYLNGVLAEFKANHKVNNDTLLR